MRGFYATNDHEGIIFVVGGQRENVSHLRLENLIIGREILQSKCSKNHWLIKTRYDPITIVNTLIVICFQKQWVENSIMSSEVAPWSNRIEICAMRSGFERANLNSHFFSTQTVITPPYSLIFLILFLSQKI